MRRLPFLFATLVLAAGCSGEDSVPKHLMDDSKAVEPAVELQGITHPALLTAVRTIRADDVEPGSLAAACLRGRGRDTQASGQLVERIGVANESVTFRGPSGRSVSGCDNSPGPREGSRRWCGGAYGVLYGGRLRDPRLDILCTTGDGRPMGFAWIEPDAKAGYIAVKQPGYTEVYEVAAGLPVRIATTTGVEIEGSHATFDLSQHDSNGRLIRKYRLDARVAG